MIPFGTLRSQAILSAMWGKLTSGPALDAIVGKVYTRRQKRLRNQGYAPRLASKLDFCFHCNNNWGFHWKGHSKNGSNTKTSISVSDLWFSPTSSCLQMVAPGNRVKKKAAIRGTEAMG